MNIMRKVFLSLFVLTATSAWSAPSSLLYQGVLQSTSGEPLTGFHDLELHFHTTLEGAQTLATVSFDLVEFTDGRFTVALEEGHVEKGFLDSDALRETPNLFLSMRVDGHIETARLRVASDGQMIFVVPQDDGDSRPSDPVHPSAVPFILGESWAGSGDGECTESEHKHCSAGAGQDGHPRLLDPVAPEAVLVLQRYRELSHPC